MRSCMITCPPCSHRQLRVPASFFPIIPPAIQFIGDFSDAFACEHGSWNRSFRMGY
jgi:hypothetical protein